VTSYQKHKRRLIQFVMITWLVIFGVILLAAASGNQILPLLIGVGIMACMVGASKR
jgi:hypothetical protein